VAACVAGAVEAASSASDETLLRALHEKVLRAHRERSVALLMEDAAPDFLEANRGEISRPTIEERRARFTSYFGSTTFSEYRDAAEPVVRVSKDGTLGWVLVRVEAHGVRENDQGKKEPLAFTAAWIELYEKRDGRWFAVGNVSNFKP